MSKATKSVPNFDNLTVVEEKLLEPGFHPLIAHSIDWVTIKNGKYAGKDALNVKFRASNDTFVWKQLPWWTPSNEATAEGAKERDWFRMSTIAFLKQADITAQALQKSVEDVLEMEFIAKVGIQKQDGYQDQNYVISFEMGK